MKDFKGTENEMDTKLSYLCSALCSLGKKCPSMCDTYCLA